MMAATNSAPALSPAGVDLGLGSSLTQQVKDETEEQRKRRLMLQQQQTALGPAAMSLGLGGYNG